MVESLCIGVEWGVILVNTLSAPAKDLATDASGSWGCGTWHGTRWYELDPVSME